MDFDPGWTVHGYVGDYTVWRLGGEYLITEGEYPSTDGGFPCMRLLFCLRNEKISDFIPFAEAPKTYFKRRPSSHDKDS